MIRQEAEKAILLGVCAALFSGLITGAISVMALLSSQPILGVDGWSILDAGIIFILAFGIYKKSRVAAWTLLGYFCLSKIIMMVETQSGSGLLSGLIFVYFYAKAVQGTMVFHSIEKMENPDYHPNSIWIVAIISSLIGLVIAFCLVIFGVAVFSNTPAGVVSGYEIETEYRQELEAANLISATDKLELVYSYGNFIAEGGNILTTDRLIRYAPKDGELYMNEIELDQIKEVVSKPNNEIFGDIVYIVKSDTNEVELRFAFEEESLIFVETLKMNIP